MVAFVRISLLKCPIHSPVILQLSIKQLQLQIANTIAIENYLEHDSGIKLHIYDL